MPAKVKGFVCQPGVWTEISSGFKSNQVRLEGHNYGYISLGDTPPSAPPQSGIDWIPLGHGDTESFGFLDTTTRMWFYPGAGQSVTVRVISE